MNEISSENLKELVYLLEAYKEVYLATYKSVYPENICICNIDTNELSYDKKNILLVMFHEVVNALEETKNYERKNKSFKEYADKVNSILNDLSSEEIKEKINSLLPSYAYLMDPTEEEGLERIDIIDKTLKHETIQ